ncbi:MAG: hypothetical protein KHZ58_04545 [Hungatella hathewayi]|mgnify:CR=1 FL=1|nr:hypothetical protein [Hungatella hathewayi]
MVRDTVKNPLTLNEIGMEALSKVLSPVDVARFLRLYENGTGDYTAERENELEDVTLNDIHTAIKSLRERS